MNSPFSIKHTCCMKKLLIILCAAITAVCASATACTMSKSDNEQEKQEEPSSAILTENDGEDNANVDDENGGECPDDCPDGECPRQPRRRKHDGAPKELPDFLLFDFGDAFPKIMPRFESGDNSEGDDDRADIFFSGVNHRQFRRERRNGDIHERDIPAPRHRHQDN